MISSFEVGAVFKIINEASPALAKILKQVRELNLAIDKARENLATLSTGFGNIKLGAATDETAALATAWGDVAKNARAAQGAIGRASATAVRSGSAAAAAAATGGGGGGGSGGGNRNLFRPGRRSGGGWLGGLGGGSAHINGPNVPLPGGAGHVRFGGAGMAAAGLVGYGAYEAAEMEDTVWQLIYHSGLQQNDANRSKFRKVLQDSMMESGYSQHDLGEAAKQEIRMFQGTPGGGIDILPEMLRAATIESRLKGETPEESMRALIGLAHMTRQYDPEAIKKLAPAFAFLSTANPSSLGAMERAASYAVPMLKSGMDVDPLQTLMLGTVLTRAGAVNTRSGTWLRNMAMRALPSSDYSSNRAYEAHEGALADFGLVDGKGKPTWFTNGKPDLIKMLDIAGAHAGTIPLDRRGPDEMALFGAQGGGGFALLADPAVRAQILALQKVMNSPEFKNRYGSFNEAYPAGSTMQQGRTAVADFNVTMMELGKTVLPSINEVLHDLKSILEGIRTLLPGGSTGTIGARVMEGAGAGALVGLGIGAFGGPIGMAGGALIGAGIGGVGGVAEEYMRSHAADAAAKNGVITGNAAAQTAENTKAIADALRGPKGNGSIFPGGTSPAPPQAPIQLNLNIDGRTLSSALSSTAASSFDGQAPAFNGLESFPNGDHQHSDN